MKNVWRVFKKQRCIYNPYEHLRWSFSVNILNGFLFLQYKLHHRSSTRLYIASENIEIFKIKLRWSKLSRLLQHVSCCNINQNNVKLGLKTINYHLNRVHFNLVKLKYRNTFKCETIQAQIYSKNHSRKIITCW